MRIALFITCLTDTLFPDTGQAVVRLLERLGHAVLRSLTSADIENPPTYTVGPGGPSRPGGA